MKLPPLTGWWPPKDWRMMLALVGSIGGGAVSFILAWRIISVVSEHSWQSGLSLEAQLQVVLRQLEAVELVATGLMILMGISMIGLWFVLGKRSIELSAGKVHVSAGGGEEEDTAAPVTRTTTVTETQTGIPPA